MNSSKSDENQSFEMIDSFDSMNLNEGLMRGVFSYGFEKPSPIQQMAIKPLISGRDSIVQAPAGQGKTATFGISILQRLNIDNNPNCQALILGPTREIAHQSTKVISGLSTYMDSIKVHTLVGGTSIREDIAKLRSGVHVIVGTPGRVYDMISRGVFSLSNLKMLVIDEADQMLDMGFKEQVYAIFQSGLPSEVQISLFSATMPADAIAMSEKFMRSPLRILVPAEKLSLEGISQFYVGVNETEKFDTIIDLYNTLNVSQSILFCNTRRRVDEVAAFMRANQFPVSVIHADIPPADRSEVISDFRAGKVRVLISSSVLSRGVDFQSLSLVVNVDLCNDIHNYIHQIGRVGRYGRKGIAINLVSDREMSLMKSIEDHYKITINPLPDDFASLL